MSLLHRSRGWCTPASYWKDTGGIGHSGSFQSTILDPICELTSFPMWEYFRAPCLLSWIPLDRRQKSQGPRKDATLWPSWSQQSLAAGGCRTWLPWGERHVGMVPTVELSGLRLSIANITLSSCRWGRGLRMVSA